MDDRSSSRRQSSAPGGRRSIREQLWMDELLQFEDQSRILMLWEPQGYLDKGTFSRIFRIVNRKTGERAVLKYVPNPLDATDCSAPGSPEDNFYQSRFDASKREAEIMNRFRGEDGIVQYLETPEYLQRAFVNEDGERVIQYAVLICMPLYENYRVWVPDIAGKRDKCLQLGVEMAHALELFEERGVYHRDIKPGNIMRDAEGHFRMGDVGEAKLESDRTTIGYHGTPSYMAPEVMVLEKRRGKARSDHRSDIYSLGIVLYRLFNEQQFPFLMRDGSLSAEATASFKRYAEKYLEDGDTRLMSDAEKARLLRYDGDALPPPSQADEQLAYVILRACAYDKEDRWQTASDFREALACCAKGQPLPDRLRANARRDEPKPEPKPEVKPEPKPEPNAVPKAEPKSEPKSAPKTEPKAEPKTAPKSEPKPEPKPEPKHEPEKAEQPATHAASPFRTQMQGDGTLTITGYTGKDAEVSIPSSIGGKAVTAIGRSAFASRDSLTNVFIPNSVTAIGSFAFANCKSLTHIIIPASVVNIHSHAFYNCASLASVIIPKSVKFIAKDAFNGCPFSAKKKLKAKAVIAPLFVIMVLAVVARYTGIGNDILHLLSPSNASIVYTDKSLFKTEMQSGGTLAITGYTGSERAISIPPVIDGKAVTVIGDLAFSFCDSLTSVTVPDSVTTIGNGAFWYCGSLTSVTFPDSVTIIGDFAFERCDSLTSVTIPGSVTSIGEGAFSSCDSLTSVTIPESVTSIGDYAFDSCPSLTLTVAPGSYAHTWAKENGVSYTTKAQ